MAIDDQPSLTLKINADTRDLEEKLNDAAKLSTRFSTALGQSFVDVSLKGKSLGDTLRTLALRLSDLTLKAVFKPLTDQLGSSLSGLVTGASLAPFAKGGAFASGTPLPTPFADGGVIASPISFPLAGNRTGLAGERGPEAILPLARGPDGSLGVSSSAGSGPSITFNVTTPDAESFRRSESQLAALLARAVTQGQRNL